HEPRRLQWARCDFGSRRIPRRVARIVSTRGQQRARGAAWADDEESSIRFGESGWLLGEQHIFRPRMSLRCCHRLFIPVMHSYTANQATVTMISPSTNVTTVARSDWDHAFQSWRRSSIGNLGYQTSSTMCAPLMLPSSNGMATLVLGGPNTRFVCEGEAPRGIRFFHNFV